MFILKSNIFDQLYMNKASMHNNPVNAILRLKAESVASPVSVPGSCVTGAVTLIAETSPKLEQEQVT